jgi:hypothetical protein
MEKNRVDPRFHQPAVARIQPKRHPKGRIPPHRPSPVHNNATSSNTAASNANISLPNKKKIDILHPAHSRPALKQRFPPKDYPLPSPHARTLTTGTPPQVFLQRVMSSTR